MTHTTNGHHRADTAAVVGPLTVRPILQRMRCIDCDEPLDYLTAVTYCVNCEQSRRREDDTAGFARTLAIAIQCAALLALFFLIVILGALAHFLGL